MFQVQWHRKSLQSLMVLTLVGSSAFAQSLRVMGYNVQNLFDTIDSPDTNDSEFTPNGSQKWTEAVLEDKMRNLGEVIRESKADIVAVNEIENQQVLEQMLQVGLEGTAFKYVKAANSKDGRGIRTGIISRFPIVDFKSHDVSSPNWVDQGRRKYGRDIFEVTVDTGAAGEGRLVTLLVNHWLSKGGGPIRDKWRADEARSIAKIIANIVKQNPTRLVISAGDFNDTLNSPPLSQNLPMIDSLAAFAKSAPETMFPLDSEMASLPPEKRGTHYFHPAHEWNTLDHLFISEGQDLKANNVKGFRYVHGSVKVVQSRFVQKGGMPQGCEILRFQKKPNGGGRTRCLEGASDHFPMLADFEYR